MRKPVIIKEDIYIAATKLAEQQNRTTTNMIDTILRDGLGPQLDKGKRQVDLKEMDELVAIGQPRTSLASPASVLPPVVVPPVSYPRLLPDSCKHGSHPEHCKKAKFVNGKKICK
jgi:hypothetical protein